MRVTNPIVASILGMLMTTAGTAFGGDLTITSFSSYAGQSNILLQAAGNINFSGGALNLPSLPAGATNGQLTVQAGGNITLAAGTAILAGYNWSVNFTAGTNFVPTTSQPVPPSGSDGIYLNNGAYIQFENGNINLWAANEVQVATGSSGVVGYNGIRTFGGGNITVTTQYGDVNAGSNPQGLTYSSSMIGTYYNASVNLGGISTGNGGNVTINAGGNVYSYAPVSGPSPIGDAGSGAFGPEPGNVTITAGGSIFGHYVLANGVGSITAGQNVGADAGHTTDPFSLSLIRGSWSVSATNGNIYLQEVRNPNGVFNTTFTAGKHSFDYDPQASVDLTAGIGVYLTGANVPRVSGNAVPVLYPPTLNITAGPGGVVLENSVTLFPSPYGNLNITNTGGGSLVAFTNSGTTTELLMSDSSSRQWLGVNSFSATDHGATPTELNNPNPVVLDISGNMENLTLITTKETEITVGGDMTNCSFSGENLHPSDVTSINVAGQIYNPSSINSVFLTQGIPILPAEDTSPNIVNNWEAILAAAVNPAAIAAINVPGNISPSQYYAQYVAPNLLFGGILSSFFYNPSTGRLSYIGSMSPTVAAELEQPLTVVRYGPDGNPLVINGQLQTETLTWVPASSIQSLAVASQGAPTITTVAEGYVIGGPGQFNIHAGSLSLGNSLGILSYGSASDQRYANLAPYVQTGGGASIDVEVDGNLEMPGSTIASFAGGSVKVNSAGGSMDLGSQELVDVENQIIYSHGIALGIYSSGGGDVDVTALGDINVDTSRIATFNGGNLNVESFQGSVNAGSGGTYSMPVKVYYLDPVTGLPEYYEERVLASGIVAYTLLDPSQVPGSASTPGNIAVITPRGDINANQGGILQEALNGNLATGPTVTLVAGTPPSATSPGYAGNINLGDSGVIGGTVNLTANGNITDLFVTPQQNNPITNAVAGTNVQFSINATGTAPINYQWFKDGTSLPGETNDVLTLTNVHRGDAATYSIVVSNMAPTVTNFFVLHVLVPQLLSTTLDPVSQTMTVSFGDAGGGLLAAQDIASFVVQSSTNLVDWSVINPTVVTNANGGLSFSFSASSGSTQSFYRVVSQ